MQWTLLPFALWGLTLTDHLRIKANRGLSSGDTYCKTDEKLCCRGGESSLIYSKSTREPILSSSGSSGDHPIITARSLPSPLSILSWGITTPKLLKIGQAPHHLSLSFRMLLRNIPWGCKMLRWDPTAQGRVSLDIEKCEPNVIILSLLTNNKSLNLSAACLAGDNMHSACGEVSPRWPEEDCFGPWCPAEQLQMLLPTYCGWEVNCSR